MRLHSIRNMHAVQRIARKQRQPQRWPLLTEPVIPMDTVARCRAQSLLAGLCYRDGSCNPDTLTLDQAHDVLAWANQRYC